MEAESPGGPYGTAKLQFEIHIVFPGATTGGWLGKLGLQHVIKAYCIMSNAPVMLRAIQFATTTRCAGLVLFCEPCEKGIQSAGAQQMFIDLVLF